MKSLAARLHANSPVTVCRGIVILVGLLQVVTCVVVALHLTGHIKVRGRDQRQEEAESKEASSNEMAAEFEASNHMPLLRPLKRSRGKTPVAHLPILPSNTHTQREVRATTVLWNPKQGLLTHFSYQDGRLLVRKPGLYYVYAKTCFRYYAEPELHHTRNTRQTHQAHTPSHQHTHHHPRTRTRTLSPLSAPPPSHSSLQRHWPSSVVSADVVTQPPSPAQLMQYVLHERPSRGGAPLRPLVVMKGGSTQRWRERGGGYNMYCLQQGRALDLRTGDGLLVRVANAWMLDPEPEGSYFGAFRIGH